MALFKSTILELLYYEIKIVHLNFPAESFDIIFADDFVSCLPVHYVHMYVQEEGDGVSLQFPFVTLVPNPLWNLT